MVLVPSKVRTTGRYARRTTMRRRESGTVRMSRRSARADEAPSTVSKADGQWFEQAVLEVLPDLLATARRLTRNATDAEDLAAEAVARGWQSLGSLQHRERFRGWLFRILTNLYISGLRTRSGKFQEEPIPDDEGSFSLFDTLHQPFLLWWSTPEQEFLDKLVREDFERALDGLPDTFRVVVVLADVRGYSYEEIAEQLGIPLGTVRSRLSRGRAMLQSALWDHACDAGLRRPLEDSDT